MVGAAVSQITEDQLHVGQYGEIDVTEADYDCGGQVRNIVSHHHHQSTVYILYLQLSVPTIVMTAADEDFTSPLVGLFPTSVLSG